RKAPEHLAAQLARVVSGSQRLPTSRGTDHSILCLVLLRPHRSSDAATESCFSIRGNCENEFASFQGLRHGNLAISSQQSRQKKTLAQWVRNFSRATNPRPAWQNAEFSVSRRAPRSPLY